MYVGRYTYARLHYRIVHLKRFESIMVGPTNLDHPHAVRFPFEEKATTPPPHHPISLLQVKAHNNTSPSLEFNFPSTKRKILKA